MRKRILGMIFAITAIAMCATVTMALASGVMEKPVAKTETKDSASSSIKSEYEQVLTVKEDGFAYSQNLQCEQVDNYCAKSGIMIPANTTIYIGKTNIASSIDVSVDGSSDLYFGITDGTADNNLLEAQVVDGSSHEIFTPAENGTYYIFLRNETEEERSAGIVVSVDGWFQQLVERQNKIYVEIPSY